MAGGLVYTTALVLEGDFGEWCSFCWQSYAIELGQRCDGCDMHLCGECARSHPEHGSQCPTCASVSSEEAPSSEETPSSKENQ